MTQAIVFRSFAFASLALAGIASTVALTGCSSEPAAADEALWCEEHGVEEKYCVLCHPEIRDDADLLLCPEHGNIPEAICTACHPELKEKYKSCPHDLPTSFCPQCSPEFAAAQEEDGESAEAEHEHPQGDDHSDGHDHSGEGDR